MLAEKRHRHYPKSMQDKTAWSQIEKEAAGAFLGPGRFPCPPTRIHAAPVRGLKPFTACDAGGAADNTSVCDEYGVAVDEYEQEHELRPGLAKIANHLVLELRKLAAGSTHEFSHTLLDGNLAWPEALRLPPARAATRSVPSSSCRRWRCRAPRTTRATCAGPCSAPVISQPLPSSGAASLTVTRSVSCGSWHGPAAIRRSQARACVFSARRPSCLGSPALACGASTSRLSGSTRSSPWSHSLLCPIRCRRPFSTDAAHSATPASHVFSGHPGYRKLAAALPRATQIPLLHLFPACKEDTRFAFPSRGGSTSTIPVRRGPRVPIAWSATLSAPTAGSARRATKPWWATAPSPTRSRLHSSPQPRRSRPVRQAHGAQRADLEPRLPAATRRSRASQAELERAAEMLDRGGRFGYRLYYRRCGREPASCSGTCPCWRGSIRRRPG